MKTNNNPEPTPSDHDEPLAQANEAGHLPGSMTNPASDTAALAPPKKKRKPGRPKGSGKPAATLTGTGVTKKLGRPSKYTTAARDALSEAIELGCNLSEAAAMVGIQAETLRRWRESHAELQPALDAAEARGIQKRLKTISDAAEESPKWAAWILEHRWPDRWSRANRGQVQVHVGERSEVTVVDKAMCDEISESWKRFEASRREEVQ
jgi:hypothetical protein